MLILIVFLCISTIHSSQYFKDIEKCIVTNSGEEYIGTVSVTKSGKKCQIWKDVIKLNLKDIKETYFSDKSFTSASNFCRNPTSISSGPWCFFGNNIEDRESCDIPWCSQVESCKDTPSGKEYSGPKNVTKSGKICQTWSEQSPHQHHFKDWNFLEKNLSITKNKCRNPDKELSPWCYTTDPRLRWDYCDIPMCSDSMSQSEYFRGRDNLRSIADFVHENIMDDLISSMTVMVSISTEFWSEEIEKKLSVWGTAYSSTCQRDLNYFEYCHLESRTKLTGKVSYTFKCKNPLLSAIVVVPLEKKRVNIEWIKGEKFIVNNVLDDGIKNYIKEVSQVHEVESFTSPIKGNGGPFFLLSDNVIPYAVTKDDKVVMTISKVGKGRIGFMGGEYFTDVSYEPQLEDFFQRVYGSDKEKPHRIDAKIITTLIEQWKSKKILNKSLIWNAHTLIGKYHVDLLLQMVKDGVNLIVGLKPWAYYYYVSKFQRSEIVELFLEAGLWPSTETVFGDLKIVKDVELKLFPLIHLFEYAKANLTAAISASTLIRETLSNIPYYEFAKNVASVTLMSKIRTKMTQVYQVYSIVIKSLVPCLKRPSNTVEKRALLDMYNSMLLNPLGNHFEAPGINFYPGTPDLRSIPLESVLVKLNLKFNDENIYVGVFIPAFQNVSVSINAQKSKKCTLTVNFHLFDVSNWDRWDKWPRTTRKYVTRTNTTRTLSNSFGGLLTILCETNNDKVALKLSNVVRVPIYDRRKRIVGLDWNELKNRDVPWAILAADSIVFIVPTIAVRNMEDPESILRLWDRMIKEEFHLRGRSVRGTYRELISTDFQIKAGYMHAGYPIGTFIQHVANPILREKYLFAEERIIKEGSWGVSHEVGHNLQENIFTFTGTVDVTNNVFTLVATETMTGLSSWNETQGWVSDGNMENLLNYIKNGNFSIWQNNPFIGLGTYAQLRAKFGWEFYRQIFRRYDTLIAKYEKQTSSMTNEEKIQLCIVETSKLVQMNLVPFYDYWSWPITQETKKELEKYPLFFPEDFFTKKTSKKVNEIIAKYGGEKLVSRIPLDLPIVVGPLKNPLDIEGDPVIEEVTVL